MKNYKIAISNQLISKIKFFKKHHGRASSNILIFAIVLIVIIKVIVNFALFPLSKTYREKLRAYIYTLNLITIQSRKYLNIS